ncbi:MAG TPA: glutaredoxin family protein, partial [Usitatibacter sp.]
VAKRRNPVTLYTGGDCGDACVKGRELLERRGIPYTERDAQINDADREALKKLVGSLYVPTLVVGEATTKGFDEDLWQAAFDSAGYPKTRLPGQASLRVPPKASPENSSAEPASK